MTSPPRLFGSSSNARSRELLSAGMAERPRNEARRATAIALGVSTTLAVSSTATAASLPLIALKWIAIGTLGGVALAGSATLAGDLMTKREPVPRAAPALTSARSVQAPTLQVEPVRPAAATREPPREATTSVVSPSRPTSALSKSASSRSTSVPALPASAALPRGQSLSREVSLIDGSRRALSSGDARTALRQLDEYDALSRTGTLDREAQLLRIDALSQSGQRAAALALAERYLASYPKDPHAARLRALVDAP